MAEKKPKISHAITNLEVGDKTIFPIEKIRSVRSEASSLGAILDRVFKASMDREARTVVVTRIS